MVANVPPPSFYADPAGLAALKKGAGDQDPKALREAARQFESLFTQMMLKSMRDANRTFRSPDSLTDSDQTDFYREMFDNQMAMQLSKGKGLGLADMLVKQLQGAGSATKDTPSAVSGVSGSKPVLQKSIPALNTVKPPTTSPAPRVSGPRFGDGDSQSAVEVECRDVQRAASTAAASSPLRIEDLFPPIDSSQAPSGVPRQDDSLRIVADTPDEFVAQLWPHAEAAGRELGVDPRTLIAHAALETGWGKYVPTNADGTCSNNLFGMKASGRWRGAAVGVKTVEYEAGVAVQKHASFRAYDSPADSFRDYATLIKSSPRYAAAIGSGKDAAAFANALQQGGYATDPNYASKLAAVAGRLGAALKTNATRPLASGRSVSAASVSGGET